MFISPKDLNQIANHGVDIIVVGAGPAGITLALRLAEKQKKVLLLEAGGLTFPTALENTPYDGQVVSRPYPLSASRLRYFGGSSNHWGGWVRPLDREDFDVNKNIPYSGWPIAYDDMVPFYTEAHEICEVTGNQYDPSRLRDISKLNLFKFDDDSAFRNSIFRFSPPTRFGERYRGDIKLSPFIFCALNTQLIHIQKNSTGNSTLVCLDADKKRVELSAKKTILAMGGIENAKVLLYSSTLSSADFGGDWVGRCFSDHFALTTSLVLAQSKINYNRVPSNSGDIMARISPSSKLLSQHGVGNLMFDLYPSDPENTLGTNYLENRAIFKYKEPGWHYKLRIVSGQRPNRNSRIELGEEVDINNVPKIKLNWNISNEDFDNAFYLINLFSKHIGSTGQGRLKIEMETAPGLDQALGVGMHHIGTTRMSESEQFGVVDNNCKVFGIPDLYIAGSSVFPTSGYSNPTLTIVALAVRLADHLS